MASGDDSTAAGAGSQATAPSNTAKGAASKASGLHSAATGRNSTANGSNCTASGMYSSAFGEYTSVIADYTRALGEGSNAAFAHSTALGQGAETTRENQVAIGTSSNTYTLAGLPSAESAAAQIGPTNFLTTDSSGNLASSIYGPASIAALDGRVGSLESYAVETRREARQGIAAAMAMTTAPMPSAAGHTRWATNVATFRGEFAGGLSFAHRFDTDTPFAFTAGASFGGNGNLGARIGLQVEF